MLRVLDELLWTLRRGGFAIATSQAIDVARAAAEVGFDDREALRQALACVIVSSHRERARFDALFDEYFTTSDGHARDFWGRLRAQGFSAEELDALRELLEAAANGAGDAALRAVATGGGELDRLLAAASIRRALEPMTSPLQIGFYAHRVLDRIGLSQASSALSRIRERLRDALGEERAGALAQAVGRELDRARSHVRGHVEQTLRRRIESPSADGQVRKPSETPFVSLTDAELDEVRLAVRRFAARLRGAARVRERHARKGRFDPHRTMRRSLRTAGIPFAPARRDRRRDKPRLVVLCDVSDSVRTAARFMLEFVYAVQELFDRTRSFVFVSDVGEVTSLFEREPVHVAMALAYGGGVVSTNDNSSYGRVLHAFEERFAAAVDARTTLVVLGDGRTNYRPHGGEVLDRLRRRARRVLWLCPEARSGWGIGDSAMPVYASKVDQVFEVRSAADLERAARELAARR